MNRLMLFYLLIFSVILSAEVPSVKLADDIELIPLTPTIWRHVSYQQIEPYGRVPANGLVIICETEAVLVDTPWTAHQTSVLLDWFRVEKEVSVVLAVPGHYHEDCMGGFPELERRGITTLGSSLTAKLAAGYGLNPPRQVFSGSKKLTVGHRELELFFPGAGHTLDNIVVWVPDEQVLFGGCIIKSLHSKDLGYIDESDLNAWPETLMRIKNRYSNATIIVPGHGAPGGVNLIDHTLSLLGKNRCSPKKNDTQND